MAGVFPRPPATPLTGSQQSALDALATADVDTAMALFAALVGGASSLAPTAITSPSWQEPTGNTVITVPLDSPSAVVTPTWSA